MAKIKRVEPSEASALLKELAGPMAQPTTPSKSDGLIAIGEILGKGLAALSGSEMAMNFAKDVKSSNDATRLKGFFDALNRGENPGLPGNLGEEAQARGQAALAEDRRQRLVGVLQLLQHLQGAETAQGQIDAQAENLQTTEAGADRRQNAQLSTTREIADADRTSNERQTQARVGAQNYATSVTQQLGKEQNDIEGRKLAHQIYQNLKYPFGYRTPGAGGLLGGLSGASSPLGKIGPLLEYVQTMDMPDAQKAEFNNIVLNSVKSILSGSGQAPQGGGALDEAGLQQLLQLLQGGAIE